MRGVGHRMGFCFFSKELESSDGEKRMMVGQMMAGLEVGHPQEVWVSHCPLFGIMEDMTHSAPGNLFP